MAGDLSLPVDGSTSRTLAQAVLGWRWQDLPPAVQHEARRCLVNFFACALAGWRDPAVATAQRVFEATAAGGGGGASFTVIGNPRRAKLLQAASLNAMAANVHDFDDTHLPTIAHPTAPVAPVVLALAERGRCTGADLLAALAAGVELQCRIAHAISPGHYARGWHITSTCGIFGAAAAAARLLGLGDHQAVWALGSAAAQASGLVETLGTMAKSIGVGNAAANGLLSALLAAEGFAGPAAPLEGERGFLRVFGFEIDGDRLCGGLGERWEILSNTYKPYPCGVVLNPVIEACLALREALWGGPGGPGGVDTAAIASVARVARVELRGHPLLRQRTDRPHIGSGRESQVSAQHAVAVVLARGRAGLDEFSDAAVADPALQAARAALGERLAFVDDAALGIEAAAVTLTLADGRSATHHVSQARGSLALPLDDAALDAKCRELARHGGSGVDAEPLLQKLWTLDREADAATLLRLARPRSTPPAGRG